MMAENQAISGELKLMKQPRWKDGRTLEKRKLELEQEFDALMQTSAGTSKEIVQLEGAHEEQQWMRDYLNH